MKKKDRKSHRKFVGENPTSHTLTAAQRRAILAKQEKIIRANRGDEIAQARAIMRIDEAEAYRLCKPPYVKIQDYCLAENPPH
jgi:hypothetical protein